VSGQALLTMGRRRSDPDRALDSALDELYSARPEEFVATRKRLAKDLRDRGDRQAAQTVQEARKPSVAAWAVNRLVRDFPKEIRRLERIGAALRETQVRIIQGGDPGDMQQRLAEARDLIARLTRAARQLLGDEGGASEAMLMRVSETLMASLADEARAEQVVQGRLVKELEPSGFGLPAGVTPSPRRARPTKAGAERRKVAEVEERLERAQHDLAKKQRDLQAAEGEEREAASRAQHAAREAEKARDAVEASKRAVEKAEEALARARR
jgi:DNA repair exonuclease SbcCD ATPase subunit